MAVNLLTTALCVLSTIYQMLVYCREMINRLNHTDLAVFQTEFQFFTKCINSSAKSHGRAKKFNDIFSFFINSIIGSHKYQVQCLACTLNWCLLVYLLIFTCLCVEKLYFLLILQWRPLFSLQWISHRIKKKKKIIILHVINSFFPNVS